MLSQIIIDENNMGFIPSIGASFQMNETAKDIIELLKKGYDKDTLVNEIAKKYNQDEKEVFIDVSDFLTKLKIYGIIK
jgi:DNA-directed RNA polymerase delta subunit